MFYQKFYADNVIVPAGVAAVSALLKEHIMMLAVRLSGGTFSYAEMVGAYVLPSMLLTVALTMPVHVLLKRALACARFGRSTAPAGLSACTGG